MHELPVTDSSALPLPDIRLTKLTLTDFRNYRTASLAMDGRHVVLTGPNGAGKTNFMEAVSLLTPGRGLRRATLADIANKQAEDGFSVFGQLFSNGDDYSVGTGTAGQQPGSGSGNGLSRRVRINGTSAKSADELMDLCRITWLTPAMDGLFTGPAGDRRRFLDRLVLAIDPAHGRRAADYEKAMRQRNRLLEAPDTATNEEWMGACEAQLAALGTAIMAARRELLTQMRTLVESQARQDQATSPFPTAELAITGELESRMEGGEPAGDIERAWVDELMANRFRDRAAGRTLTGPHRADLVVINSDKAMAAAQCSTGEQKALLIGLVLAHAALTRQVSGMAPILLLDEVAAHLDPDRRVALFERVDGLGGQAFMTGTDVALFAALAGRAQFVHVQDGELHDG